MMGMMPRQIAAVIFVVAAGCGRLGFEARTDSDANRDADGPDATESAYAKLVKADGPAAYWRFEESAGTIAVDEMGTYPGTFTGRVSRAAGIAGGRAAVFDGSTTRVVVGDVFAFPGTAPYTLEVWVMPSVVDDNVMFVIDRTSVAPPDDGYQLYFAESFTLNDRSVQGIEGGYASGPGLLADRWTHVVGTYDGTVTALYMDGVLISSTGAPVLPASSPGRFTLGDLGTEQAGKYIGMMDEVAIYPTALSEVRIAAHAAAGRP